jgi:hypothetical protein
MTSAPTAEHMRWLHPLRLQYELFSDMNPWMASVQTMVERAKENRTSVGAERPVNGAWRKRETEYDFTLDCCFITSHWPEHLRPSWIRAAYVEEKLNGSTGVIKDYEWVFRYR